MTKMLLNDEIIERDNIIDIEDRAYQFGDGIYEVIGVYGGKPFMLEEHMERLQRSAREIQLALPYTIEQLKRNLVQLLTINGLDEGIIYMQVSRGIASREHYFPGNGVTPVTIAYTRAEARMSATEDQGATAVLAEDIRWLRCDIKTLNLLPNALSKQKAVENNAIEAILHRGDTVTEASSSNVFIVKKGEVFTHPANNYILNGITRRKVIQLCQSLGIQVHEKTFTVESMLEADEVFVTATKSDIIPILKIDSYPIGKEKPGEITTEILHAFRSAIRDLEKIAQIMNNYERDDTLSTSIKLSANHPTVAKIDLDAFNKNLMLLKQLAKKSIFLAVVKTNAYGHGIVPISQEAVSAGADRLGVTTVEEGALLREKGIQVPIHILSSIVPRQAMDIAYYDLIPSISSHSLAMAVSDEALKQGKIISVHLKIDTGLHRFGIDPSNAVDFSESCYALPGLYWEGVYTHFPNADEGDWQTTEQQFTLFMDTVDRLNERGFDFPIRHVGGSTITLERPDMHLDMVRPGISLFGYTPADRQKEMIALHPVMTLQSELIQVRELPPNTPVGYGGSYVTKSYEKIAIVPIGHGDGYKRSLVNKGKMLVGGKRVNIVGSISLDQTLIDVTDIPNIAAGDEIILLGKQENDEITARDIADWMDSIVDEVVASLTERIRRIYVHGIEYNK